MQKGKLRLKDEILFLVMALCVLLNGFQAGSNQAFLTEIQHDLNVSGANSGILPAIQWTAVIIAPIITGLFADKVGKKPFLLSFLGLFFIASIILFFTNGLPLYLTGVFLVGLAISVFQFIALAIIIDCYPLSQDKRMSIATSMYSIGAILAPLIANLFIKNSVNWRYIYLLCGISAFLLALFAAFIPFTPKEERKLPVDQQPGEKAKINYWGIGIICAIAGIYVGVESGFAYYIKPFISEDLGGMNAELAISLFWLGMLPSRVISAYFSKYKLQILIGSLIVLAGLGFSFGFINDVSLGLALSFFLGFFCGPVYPDSVSYASSFAPGKSGLATGLITASTGIGAALVTFLFPAIQARANISVAFIFLGSLVSLIIVLTVILALLGKKKPQNNRIESKK